jgi:hypothetical protein
MASSAGLSSPVGPRRDREPSRLKGRKSAANVFFERAKVALRSGNPGSPVKDANHLTNTSLQSTTHGQATDERVAMGDVGGGVNVLIRGLGSQGPFRATALAGPCVGRLGRGTRALESLIGASAKKGAVPPERRPSMAGWVAAPRTYSSRPADEPALAQTPVFDYKSMIKNQR